MWPSPCLQSRPPWPKRSKALRRRSRGRGSLFRNLMARLTSWNPLPRFESAYGASTRRFCGRRESNPTSATTKTLHGGDCLRIDVSSPTIGSAHVSLSPVFYSDGGASEARRSRDGPHASAPRSPRSRTTVRSCMLSSQWWAKMSGVERSHIGMWLPSIRTNWRGGLEKGPTLIGMIIFSWLYIILSSSRHGRDSKKASESSTRPTLHFSKYKLKYTSSHSSPGRICPPLNTWNPSSRSPLATCHMASLFLVAYETTMTLDPASGRSK
mmetsp:Transcript_673/g.1882  ORF Transcript_673/g.1882 Transcript_673/m.1882 type:complete len:268 (-) Transcript_673:2280-3083(-)